MDDVNQIKYKTLKTKVLMKSKDRVYVISNQAIGLVKIGVSKNPEQRMKTLQCNCGMKLFVWHQTIEMDCAYELESRLHKHFAPYRTYGEWFRIPKKGAAKQVIKIMNKMRLEGKL